MHMSAPAVAEAEGFEPTRPAQSGGFKDRCIRPLCHTSVEWVPIRGCRFPVHGIGRQPRLLIPAPSVGRQIRRGLATLVMSASIQRYANINA